MTLDASNIITLIALAVGAWNLHLNTSIKNCVLELQINMRREFNGRYVTKERFEDLKKEVDEHV